MSNSNKRGFVLVEDFETRELQPVDPYAHPNADPPAVGRRCVAWISVPSLNEAEQIAAALNQGPAEQPGRYPAKPVFRVFPAEDQGPAARLRWEADAQRLRARVEHDHGSLASRTQNQRDLAYAWEALQFDQAEPTQAADEPSEDICGPAGEQTDTSAGPANVTGWTVDTVREAAERYVKKHSGGWPGQNALADLIDCPRATLGKAIPKSTYLKARKAEHKAASGGGREVSMTDAIMDSTPQATEADRQAAIDELSAESKSEEASEKRQYRAWRRSQARR